MRERRRRIDVTGRPVGEVMARVEQRMRAAQFPATGTQEMLQRGRGLYIGILLSIPDGIEEGVR